MWETCRLGGCVWTFNRVSYNVRFATQTADIIGAVLLVNLPLVKMWKDKAVGRYTMPDWVLVLHRRAEFEFWAGRYRESDCSSCVVCQAAEASGIVAPELEDVVGCATCTRIKHSECAAYMHEALHSDDEATLLDNRGVFRCALFRPQRPARGRDAGGGRGRVRGRRSNIDIAWRAVNHDTNSHTPTDGPMPMVELVLVIQ